MIAYLIHTGVISDSGIGWVRVASSDGMGHHSSARVEMGCTSLSFRVSSNKVQTALFSPSAFHIGVSGDYGVGLVIHASKVGDDKEIGMANKR